MNRASFLKIYNINVESWINRYGIEPFESPCYKCGLLFKTTIPIAKGELRGLISEVCSCGNSDTPYCLVRDPTKGDLLDRDYYFICLK
jgi:hypothetical protein